MHGIMQEKESAFIFYFYLLSSLISCSSDFYGDGKCYNVKAVA